MLSGQETTTCMQHLSALASTERFPHTGMLALFMELLLLLLVPKPMLPLLSGSSFSLLLKRTLPCTISEADDWKAWSSASGS